MRYIANANGYLQEVSFGADIACEGNTCTEYTGAVPTGYDSLEAWYLAESDKLYRWQIIDGALTLDSSAVAPAEETPALSVYPVGSIYLTVNATNPGDLFGGTWQQIKDRFLLAAGDTYAAGSMGGEAEHTLTVEEIPEHSHEMTVRVGASAGSYYSQPPASGNNGEAYDFIGTVGDTGGGQAHNNLPPYLTVYVWQRIA